MFIQRTTTPSVKPLTRWEAFVLAVTLWGERAVVGVNHSYRNVFYVGVNDVDGVWLWRGVGTSWEQAFLGVEELPEGRLPRTHGSKRAPDAI